MLEIKTILMSFRQKKMFHSLPNLLEKGRQSGSEWRLISLEAVWFSTWMIVQQFSGIKNAALN